MPSLLSRSTLMLVALLALGGCAHRLSGPIHDADGPPWTRDDLAVVVGGGFVLEHRVLLIGDAGYYLEDDPPLAALGA
jgi:hypothetical protein